jgi:hypothetical protein
VDCVYLGQDRRKWRTVADAVMKLLVLKKAGFLCFGTACSFSRRTQLHGVREIVVKWSTVTC